MALAEAAADQKRRNPAAIQQAIADLAAAFGNRLVTAHAVREQHGNTLTWVAEPAARRGGVSADDRGRAAHRAHLRRARRSGHRLRHRHLAGRPRQRAIRRRIDRFPRHEQGARGARRGSRLRDRAGRHPQGAQRASARQRPVLSDRSRRRRLARRHGGDARLRHQCGALRHHEGQRAGDESGDGGRRADDHRRGAPRNPPPATTSPG